MEADDWPAKHTAPEDGRRVYDAGPALETAGAGRGEAVPTRTR